MANDLVQTGVTIPMPAEEDLGPAMLDCTDMERRFVVAWQHLGNRERACVAAGYSAPNRNALGVAAWQVWHRPRVQAAILELSRTSGMICLVPGAFAAMQEVLEDKSHKDRIKVAEMVLNRTGMHAMTEHKMTVTHVDGSREKQIQQIIALAKATGQDPRVLLGNCDDITDADYEVLDKETGKDGLEDLL